MWKPAAASLTRRSWKQIEVRDADGSIRGDDGDHFGSGAIRPAMEALTLEDFRALQARRWRGRFF